MRLPALFAPTLLLVACSGEGLPLNAPDAGPPSDAPDAAPPDAGPSDGGQPPDAGQAPDAGQPDPLQRRDPEDLGFGPVELGREAELTVVLSAADAPRTITLEGDAALRMAPESLAVDPGDEATLQLRFSPTAEGAFRAALVITEGADARRVEVRGDGALTALRCRALTAPLQLAAGQCGTARVACGNEGLGPTTFANVTLTGAGASTRFQDFGPLAPLESRTFEVSICPEATGPFQVVVTAQAPAAQAVVQLQGESAGPRLRAGAVALPPLTLGIPQRLEVPLHNAGLAPAHIDMVEVLGLDPGELTVVRAPAGLAAGFDAVVELRLTATQAGLRSAVLRVHSDDERSPTLDIPLALEVEARPCALTLSPPAIDFGTTTPAGPVRRIAQLVIEHTGQTTCALSMPPLPAPFGLGAVPPDAWSDDEGTHLLLAPGARRAVPIELTGSALGAMSATLSLRYGTPTGAAVLPIPLDARSVAAGLVAEVEPMCLWPGATAARQTVRLSSAAPVVLRQLALDPLGAELGPLTAPPLPVTVTSGALDLGVDLGPQTEGPHLGLLTIEHEVGGEQRVLHVSVGAVVSGFTTVDEFEQLGIPQLDVLWIQDGSASMLDNDLQSGLQDFARHLAAPGQWDARLAVARLDRHLDEDAVVREARGAPVAGRPRARPRPVRRRGDRPGHERGGRPHARAAAERGAGRGRRAAGRGPPPPRPAPRHRGHRRGRPVAAPPRAAGGAALAGARPAQHSAVRPLGPRRRPDRLRHRPGQRRARGAPAASGGAHRWLDGGDLP
ncbi:MAG: hypothetical protein H6730_14470 [Deltaproteobacteria bacterium]|nr:hypothetical protein [Deltaproteobacteria bacterium]